MSLDEGHYVCKNLNLSIRLEPDFRAGGERIRIRLEDPLAMLQTECLYEVNQTTLPNRSYHLREAITIAMRRLVSQAITESLITVTRSPNSPGVSMSANAPAPLTAPRGIEVDIRFSTDEELW